MITIDNIMALEALESGAWDTLSGSRVSAAIRGRLGEKE